MDAAGPKSRWFCLTPDRFVVGLLIVECLLWVSNWLGWPAWHKGYAVLVSIAAVGAALILLLLWFAEAVLLRRRFQFGISTLLVFTAVVAIPCSWLTVEMKRATGQRETVEAIEKQGGMVAYDSEVDVKGMPVWGLKTEPHGMQGLLGADFFADAAVITWASREGMRPGNSQFCTDETLRLVAQLPKIWWFVADAGGVTDSGLPYLYGMANLRRLYLLNARVTTDAVARLQDALPNCEVYH